MKAKFATKEKPPLETTRNKQFFGEEEEIHAPFLPFFVPKYMLNYSLKFLCI